MAREKKFNTKYSPEFKLSVIPDMREHRLNYSETVRKFWGVNSKSEISLYRQRVRQWERKYKPRRSAYKCAVKKTDFHLYARVI